MHELWDYDRADRADAAGDVFLSSLPAASVSRQAAQSGSPTA